MIKHPTLCPLNSHSKVVYNPVNLDECVLALTKPYIGCNKWTDYSGYGNDGTIYGATKDSDGFLSFDGIDDYVNCKNDPSLYLTDMITIDMLVRFNDLITKQTVASNYEITGWRLSVCRDVADSISFRVAGDGYYTVHFSTSLLNVNDVHHITATLFDDTLKLYLNGIEKDSITGANLGISTANVIIGAESDAGNSTSEYFRGVIARAHILSRCMSPLEILSLNFPIY